VKTVSIHEAKTHLSRLIQQALDGEEIVIANRNEPMVRLQVIREALPQRHQATRPSARSLRGRFHTPMASPGSLRPIARGAGTLRKTAPLEPRRGLRCLWRKASMVSHKHPTEKHFNVH
jgi:prevent-host-death family protein